MSRRFRGGATPPSSALGENHLSTAIETIDKLCQRTVTAMTEYTVSRNKTIEALFTPDTLAKALAARLIIEPSSHIIGYDIPTPGGIEASAEVSINYREASFYPPINEGVMHLQESSGPLLRFIEQVRGIHEQFEEIKAVLRWLNRNATPGAIRYYFPTALALCPNSPPMVALQHVPTRYTQPKDIGDWMQIIKDASACYAGTQMLPATAKRRERNEMWLTFRAYQLQRGPILFCTDSRIYNI